MRFVQKILAIGALGCVSAQETILEAVESSTSHSTLAAAVGLSPQANALLGSSEVSLTLFAPDNSAFLAVDQAYLLDLLTLPWAEHLHCLLTSHVLGSAIISSDIPGEPTLIESLSGYEFEVENTDGAVTADGIPVTMADLAASNGVVHVITERPILPDCVT